MAIARKAVWLLSAALTASAALAGVPFGFSSRGNLNTARFVHNAILLNNGKVLVVGGEADNTGNNYTGVAELFDPATGTWSGTGSLLTKRSNASATLLPSGRVLVAGGSGSTGALATAELYDPVTGTWSATGSMGKARELPTAVLLPGGKVLVAGGFDSGNYLASAELYDPATGTWSNTGSLLTGRIGHTLTLLPSGKVLASAGFNRNAPNTYLRSAEIYDPGSGTWSVTGIMATARVDHSATLLPNGKVLVGAGHDGTQNVTTAELFDPGTGSWTLTGSPLVPRFGHSATLLPNGKLLFAGGYEAVNVASSKAELYDAASGQWAATGSLTQRRTNHTATLLPSGQVLLAGGRDSAVLASTEQFEPALGTWAPGGSLVAPRSSHTATILSDGRVLVAGGADAFGVARPLAEIYDPVTNKCTLTGSLATARQYHTATLLGNGKVLVTGGIGSGNSPVTSSELFDPVAGTWSSTGALGTSRDMHTATLLPNGKVYVAGGETVGGGLLFAAEIYDPATGKWSATGNMINARRSHAATLLPNGKVLLIQGFNTGSFELYDPAVGTCTNLLTLSLAIYDQTATLLPNGKVLIAGGQANNGPQRSGFVYDPVTGNLFAGSPLAVGRHHTATLLPNGQVLVAGGIGINGALSSAELFDPSGPSFPGTWSATTNLATEHAFHTATLLLNGKVLLAGGRDGNGNSLTNTEIYDVGLNFSSAWQPQITSSPAIANRGAKLALGGVRFAGVSQASSGTYQDSSTSYPVMQLRRIDNGQVSWFLVDPATGWSDTTTATVPLSSSVPLGPSLVTIFTNGIPSAAKYLQVAPKSTQALNISTRLKVQQNDNVLIGGFIVTGSASKKIIVRGIGPSLKINGVPLSGRLGNPFLELHDEKAGVTLETNDNWKINDQTGQSQQAIVEGTTIPPTDDLESAIVRTLTPGPYTAILRGVNNGVGIGVVEVYDLDQAADSEMANISTRGFVDTGDNVMIGGFILGNSTQGSRILVRGIGPSLLGVGIPNALQNPTLELRDGNGALLGSNDNWKVNDQTQQSQEMEIRATTIPPANDLESAILNTLPPGNYTAILAGKNSGVGVAVLEVYNLH